jgi:hypothetical protein
MRKKGPCPRSYGRRQSAPPIWRISNGFRTTHLGWEKGPPVALEVVTGFRKHIVFRMVIIMLIARTWLIFSLSSVFSTKDILDSRKAGSPPLSSPTFLTAYQMSLCSVASYFLPLSRSTAASKPDQSRRNAARLLLSGVILCFNYAYVDLENSFIQMARVSGRIGFCDT